MKKGILFLCIALIGMAFTSCSDDDEAPILGAYVGVTVKNLAGTLQDGVKVYMFKNVNPDEDTDIASATKVETTDANGVAHFKLNLTELSITESQTYLYFAVYYNVGDDVIFKAGDQGVTVKRDDEKNITITIPI